MAMATDKEKREALVAWDRAVAAHRKSTGNVGNVQMMRASIDAACEAAKAMKKVSDGAWLVVSPAGEACGW